ncbi:hypothetical protein J4558_25555 [Leptolyngbya sp. 15MV]|nr:hypothetical protein J4558_25555 [Leptolyngbya sp. 15MV]
MSMAVDMAGKGSGSVAAWRAVWDRSGGDCDRPGAPGHGEDASLGM